MKNISNFYSRIAKTQFAQIFLINWTIQWIKSNKSAHNNLLVIIGVKFNKNCKESL